MQSSKSATNKCPLKLLIVEEYDHPKVLENLYHLLDGKCDVTFFINQDRLKSRDLLFPSARKAKLIVNRFHSSTIFLGLLFYGRKYDYINISTGPEGSHFSDILNILAFYFCCLIYSNKIILTIKRIKSYLKSSGGLFSLIRSKGVKKLKRFTFETQTMRDIFKNIADVQNALLGVSYDRYTDLLNPRLIENKASNPSNKINIGLLGTINPERRDYEILIEVLAILSPKELSKIKFVTLGASHRGPKNNIVNEISRYAEVDLIKGWISADEFDERGVSCDLLFSPLKEGYGKYNGSGSFGDAVYLRKKIILPSYADEQREFSEIAIYYENKTDLLKIFKNINELSKSTIAEDFFDRFSSRSVFNQLIVDLKLHP